MAAPRAYYGKPENQKNPAAPNLHPGRDAGNHNPPAEQPAQSRVNKPRKGKPPPTLNKPTALHSASAQKIDNTNPFASSNFALGTTQREDHVRETFQPSCNAITELTRRMFSQLTVADATLPKKLIPEALDYYGSCMLWARLIGIKDKLNLTLTPVERQLQEKFENQSFNLPEPLRLFLLTFGRITTVLGTHLQPRFPALPEDFIDWNGLGIPGMYANVEYDANTHNLYEEIPSLGISIAAMITAQNNQVGPWQPPGLPDQWIATTNLLGYRPTKTYRPESYSYIIDAGISAAEVICDPPTSGFNFDIIDYVSQVLATCKTYKTPSVCIPTMSEFGSQAQLAKFIPEQQGTTPNINSPATIQSINSETDTNIGIALAFTPRYFKESDLQHSAAWSCARPPNQEPLPQEWFDNRNERRIMRDIYGLTQFTTVSVDAKDYRTRVLDTFVLT